MKRLDSEKTTLVDFLRSIKYNRYKKSRSIEEFPAQLADFNPRARHGQQQNGEDEHLIRSGN